MATDRWHPRAILGSGGFATVYKGKWKSTDVAIKRIKYQGSDQNKNTKADLEQSFNELRYLNACRHDNVLPIYGYSINGIEPCIVYQLMHGGSLAQRLVNKKRPLTVEQRFNIAIGTARLVKFFLLICKIQLNLNFLLMKLTI